VELAQNARRLEQFIGQRWGLWRARIVHLVRQKGFPALSPLYWWLSYSPKLHWLLRRLVGRRLKVLRLHSAQGSWLKVLLGRRVIARWQPGQPKPVVRKPYDVLLLREHIPNPEEPSCIKRET